MEIAQAILITLVVILSLLFLVLFRKGTSQCIRNIEKYDPCVGPRNVYFNCIANCGNDKWCTDICKRTYYQAAGVSLDCAFPF